MFAAQLRFTSRQSPRIKAYVAPIQPPPPPTTPPPSSPPATTLTPKPQQSQRR
jgi:hypothetical protein